MAWVEKREKGYRVGWREGGRDSKPLHRTCPTLRAARELAKRIDHDVALHGRCTLFDPEEQAPALVVQLEAWLDALEVDGIKSRTIQSYSDGANLFLRYLTDVTGQPRASIALTALNRDHLVGYQAWLLRGGGSPTGLRRRPSTMGKRAQAVRLAWEWVMEGPHRKWLDQPPKKVKTQRVARAVPRAPSWDDADRVLFASIDHDPRAPWLAQFVWIARCTGLRRSEILRLQWADFDLDRGTLLVPAEVTKGEMSGRRMPVAPVLLDELRSWPRVGPWVVTAPEGERVAARGDGRGHVDRNVRRAWVRAGVDPEKYRGQPCHAFRKLIQTELEYSGIRREVTDYLVGHQPTGTGGVYYVQAERALWPELERAVALIPAPPVQQVATVVEMRRR